MRMLLKLLATDCSVNVLDARVFLGTLLFFGGVLFFFYCFSYQLFHLNLVLKRCYKSTSRFDGMSEFLMISKTCW